ncbi:carbamoyl-phosphate synthase large subunit [Miniphocaeibacter massiliensis]|uniref:carbamoyl-phosphate synthase large subunit n=1 Tax=Miniphocaeibacter massiliensis TaxID=2041841 RepID=UPI000C1C1DF6|nr:carbamoyl-phosphate synthase large subunit [Miniphocaeibacter massiliensis]
MPRNKDIKKVLVIGSGPIVIGQAAEFDYSGTQSCESLKEEGVEVVLINSNPATIMTDREVADKVYIEPITAKYVEKIIERERPDSVISGMGGQTGLNMLLELENLGILKKYDLKVIGTKIDSIEKGEDREKFRELMEEIEIPIIQSKSVNSVVEAKEYAKVIGYPVIVRPAYTLGGTGGGIAGTEEELIKIAENGIHLSMNSQVLIEKCISGWKEIEYEVIRDSKGNCITVCNMENMDPVGVHTGDSIVVAPTQTLTDKEHQMLRKAAFKIIEAVGIEGGCNVQFALEPNSFEYAVIEINPRVSRSSALASKATGYPIARVATKIALGFTLDEIENAITKTTSADFEPAIDYVVIKIPKWPFDKFFYADRELGTKMMATGEVMGIGTSFEMALLKAIRSLEIKQFSLDLKGLENISIEEIKKHALIPDDERIFYLARLLRIGYDMKSLSKQTGIDLFFLKEIKNIVDTEEELKKLTVDDLTKERLIDLKRRGFSDKAVADFLNISPNFIYELRKVHGVNPTYRKVDTCAGLYDAKTPYYYSSYCDFDESKISKNKKVIVIGSGPIRIGQGIEFDYCSVHCVKALKKQGIETIIINNNPETVSTDFDVSDKLYFEPLTEEDVYSIVEIEKPYGVILQFGGQTAIKLAKFLNEKNVNILGSSQETIDTAEDREKFDELLEELSLQRPKGFGVFTLEEGKKQAKIVGYPVLVRPSYVLGGQGMEICHNENELIQYLVKAFEKDSKNPVLIDKYIEGKEVEIDAICDGEDILIPGIMEHVERAGIHSGDSISVYPSINISQKNKEDILKITKDIALKLNIIGMLNIQFIIKDEKVYIIEVNPRSSRTVPYISKVTGLPLIEIATKVMLGEKLNNLDYGTGIYKESKIFCVKVPVFSTEKLGNIETSLGPEMRSTGEALGVGSTPEEAFKKGLLAAGTNVEYKERKILLTLNDRDKEEFKEIATKMKDLNYDIYATKNTSSYLTKLGVKNTVVNRIGEKRPNLLDYIKEGKFDIVFNTPTKGNDSKRDGFTIRRAAVESKVELVTSVDKAKVFVNVITNRNLESNVFELGEYTDK